MHSHEKPSKLNHTNQIEENLDYDPTNMLIQNILNK
jgi:hypothetical protein